MTDLATAEVSPGDPTTIDKPVRHNEATDARDQARVDSADKIVPPRDAARSPDRSSALASLSFIPKVGIKCFTGVWAMVRNRLLLAWLDLLRT